MIPTATREATSEPAVLAPSPNPGQGKSQRHPSSSSASVFLMTSSGDTGGTERQFAVMAEALSHGPFHVETGCLRKRGIFFDNLPEIQEFPLGGSFLSRRALQSGWELRKHLRRRKIAVAHAFDFYTNLMLLPTARLAGTPVVIGSMRQLGDRLTPAKTRMLKWVLRNFPDRVVCNSRAAADRLLELGVSASKLAVIPNALPNECFDPVAPVLPPGNNLRVGLIARMNEKVKNQAALLRAAALVLEDIPNLEIVLAGDGALRPELEKLAVDLGIARQVLFLGERREVAAVLASIDISTLTSLSESMPNAILEAMAAGLPVVSTRVGGCAEVIRHGETGFLVDSGDVAQLADALRTLLRNESLRKQFGARGREVARSQFGVATIQKQYEELYTVALREKRSSLLPLVSA